MIHSQIKIWRGWKLETSARVLSELRRLLRRIGATSSMARNHQLGLGSWPAGPLDWRGHGGFQSHGTQSSSHSWPSFRLFFFNLWYFFFPHFLEIPSHAKSIIFRWQKKGAIRPIPTEELVLQHPVDLIQVGLRRFAKAGPQWVQLDMGKPYWRLVLGILTSGALLKVCHIYDNYHTVYHYIKLPSGNLT